MNNDPFEEFEFKPLTEGLGFHKKAEQIKADKDSSRLAQDRVARTIPDRPPVTPAAAPKNAGTAFTGTLSAPTSAPTPASDSISKIMSTLPPSFGSPGLDFLEETPAKKPAPVPGALAGGAANVPAAPSYKNAEFQSRLEESFAKAFPKSAVRSRGEADLPKEPKGIFGKAIARANAAVSSSAKTPAATMGAGATAAGPAVAARAANTNAARTTTAAPAANANRATAANFSASGMTNAASFGAAATNFNAAATANPSTTFFATDAAAGETLFTRSASISSAIVDGFAVLGLSVLCLVIILMMTKADLVGLLTNAQTDGAAQMHLAILYVVMLQLYMLVCRSFVGATLGEWSFDTQLGTVEDQQQASYPLKVVGRTLIITATAFILPLISYFMDRDLLEPITGLSLYSHDQDLK